MINADIVVKIILQTIYPSQGGFVLGDPIPFTSSSPPLCSIDSEHLEGVFEILRCQHAVKTLGVPSVANQGVRIFTCATGSSPLGGSSLKKKWDDDPFLDSFGSLSLLPFQQRSGGDDQGSGGNDQGSDGYGGGMDDGNSRLCIYFQTSS